ncbi:DUF3397 domain-containing protein [Salibacterium sp. K-3]
MLTNIVVFIGAALLTLPPAAWYIIYLGVVKTTKNKGRALRTASDSTTVFFIAAVHLLLKDITGSSYLWLLFVLVLLIASAFTIIHYRTRQDIAFLRLTKGIWRFTFFLFLAVYLLLSVYVWGTGLLSAFNG